MTAEPEVAEERPELSVVTPVLDERASLAEFAERLAATMTALGTTWEWIVVDDHSGPETQAALQRLTATDPRVRVVRLTRNVGSHAAIVCGLAYARGAAAIVLAVDLQDSPEDIPRLVVPWRAGSPVVWGTRADAEGTRSRASRTYEWSMRRLVGIDALPPTNADVVLLDRRVIDAVGDCDERRVPVFMLVAWLGFPQTSVECTKHPCRAGSSGWTTTKRVELAVDSVVAFTERPLRWIAVLGVATAILGLLYAVVVVANAALGTPVTGWSSLMVVVLVLGGTQMLMLGVIGAYVWRSLDETRRRPRYVVERDSAAGR